MAQTSKFRITLVEEGQQNAHQTLAEAIIRLEAFGDLSVIDKDLTTPPGTPSDGDCYIVAASATGKWNDNNGNIALYDNTTLDGWIFIEPFEGCCAWVEDTNNYEVYDGSTWQTVYSP